MELVTKKLALQILSISYSIESETQMTRLEVMTNVISKMLKHPFRPTVK